MKNKFLNSLIILTLTGCTAIEEGYIKPPLVYRVDIQQGNVVDQAMVNKLKVGMGEKQVRFIMGTPLLIDPFHPDRWDYLYFFQEGGGDAEQRHITLYFKEGKLSHLSGDIKVSHIPIQEDTTRSEKSVVVPDGYKEEGLLERWLGNKPELQEKTVREEAVLYKTLENETTEVDTEIEEQQEITESETNETEDVVAETEALDEEQVEDDEPGFFSRMWDKIIPGGGDATDETGVLEPDLENK